MNIILVLVSVIVILSVLLIAAICAIVLLIMALKNSKQQLRWYNMSSK